MTSRATDQLRQLMRIWLRCACSSRKQILMWRAVGSIDLRLQEAVNGRSAFHFFFLSAAFVGSWWCELALSCCYWITACHGLEESLGRYGRNTAGCRASKCPQGLPRPSSATEAVRPCGRQERGYAKCCPQLEEAVHPSQRHGY